MNDGLSASSFAGVIRCSMDTISEWKKVHPEFSEAIKRGQALRTLWWEKRLGTATKSDVVAVIFALKNIAPDQWRDRRELELNGQIVTYDPSLLLAASDLAKKLQVVDVQTIEPKQIVDQTVNKEVK